MEVWILRNIDNRFLQEGGFTTAMGPIITLLFSFFGGILVTLGGGFAAIAGSLGTVFMLATILLLVCYAGLQEQVVQNERPPPS